MKKMTKPKYLNFLVVIVLIIVNLTHVASSNKNIKIKKHKNLLVLNDANFDEAVKRYKYLFVEICKTIMKTD
jgi:hypothetical protein